MSFRKSILPLIGVSLVCGLAGCGGPGSLSITTPSQPVTIVFFETPPASLAINASTQLSAGVSQGASNPSITWSVTCASAACGTLSSTSSISGGPPVTYTAPAVIPTGGTVTVKATAVADTTKSVSGTITIVPPIPIAVSLGTTPASLQVNATQTISATIVNDVSANPQVQWMVTCGSGQCGTFSLATTASGVPTTYTAPSAIPPGNTVTITATSLTDPTKSASAGIVIAAPAPTLANGTYVFQLSGAPGLQATFTTGVFVAKGGAITGGEQDTVSFSTDSNNEVDTIAQSGSISGGSYSTTADGNLQLSLNVAQYGTETLTGALASNAQGLVANLYGSPGRGTLDLQTSTTAPSGGYAISLYGGNQYAQAAWIGGILNIDSPGGISGNGSILDLVGGSAANNTQTTDLLAASTVSAPDSFGRVQIKLLPAASSNLQSLYLAGYIVDATHIRLIETAADNFLGVLGGIALGQGTNTGKFSSSSLAGTSYVFGLSGYDRFGTLQVAGLLTANSTGTLGGTLNWNDQSAKTTQSPIPLTGTWAVDPTGRATLSNLTDGATFNYSLHLYLTGDGTGLLLSNDGADTTAGQAFQQQPGAFTAASFSGSYGLSASQTSNASGRSASANGSVTSTAVGQTDTLTGYADPGSGAVDYAISGNFSAGANGVSSGTLTGLNPASRTASNSFTLYQVNSSQAILIETDNTELTLGYLALQ